MTAANRRALAQWIVDNGPVAEEDAEYRTVVAGPMTVRLHKVTGRLTTFVKGS